MDSHIWEKPNTTKARVRATLPTNKTTQVIQKTIQLTLSTTQKTPSTSPPTPLTTQPTPRTMAARHQYQLPAKLPPTTSRYPCCPTLPPTPPPGPKTGPCPPRGSPTSRFTASSSSPQPPTTEVWRRRNGTDLTGPSPNLLCLALVTLKVSLPLFQRWRGSTETRTSGSGESSISPQTEIEWTFCPIDRSNFHFSWPVESLRRDDCVYVCLWPDPVKY